MQLNLSVTEHFMEKGNKPDRNRSIDLAPFERPRSLNDMAYESIKGNTHSFGSGRSL
jgi:hypothetical protein